MQASDIYADIRPYNDEEVSEVLQRLLASKDLHQAIIGFNLPWLPSRIRNLFTPVLRSILKKQLRDVHTVEQFQLWLTGMLELLLKRTCKKIEVRGLDRIPLGQTHLWLSNHRDIAMDPLLINYSLHKAGWPTSRIAIGDNLLSNDDVADIMRLNKSFVVKRNIDSRRQKLQELQKLSAYIRQSVDEGNSIWIAHKEGRAKDGIDKTDTAVLKMLALHGRPLKESFSDTMHALQPVPVSIQYEWDPCDLLKARELVAIENTGVYKKTDNEDTQSIVLGLLGKKGRVIIDFGQPLTSEECASPESMAKAVDAHIQNAQQVTSVQRTALGLLQRLNPDYKQVPGARVSAKVAKKLKDRLKGQNQDISERMLMTYCMPLLQANKKAED